MRIKYLFSLLLVTSFRAFALCEVSGISDSPQALQCQFGDTTVALSCRSDAYFLDEEKIRFTWHEEVEGGNVPLVFKSPTRMLKVVKLERAPGYMAFLETSTLLTGTCQ